MPSKNNAQRAPEMKPEEDDRIDRWPATIGIAVSHPRPNEAQVEGGVEAAVEVVGWDEPFERDDGGPVEITSFGWSKHDSTSAGMENRVTYPTLLRTILLHRAAPFLRRGHCA
jgi:hypothetical protein